MKIKVQLIQSDEGFAVSCPSLPGCHSQGDTEDDAMKNIYEAAVLWLETFAELHETSFNAKEGLIKEIEIPIGEMTHHA